MKRLAVLITVEVVGYISLTLPQQIEIKVYPNWMVEEVDRYINAPDDGGQHFGILAPDIDIDSYGHPHILYSIEKDPYPFPERWRVYYASYDGESWVREEADYCIKSYFEDPSNLILYNGNPNDPRLLWTHCPPRYTYKKDGEWTTEIVDETEGKHIYGDVSLDLDDSGVPHIAYVTKKYSPNRVKYARRTGEKIVGP